MQVKGTAFLARRALIEKDVGAARVKTFLDRFLASHRGFPSPVLPTTLIPIELFLELQDAIVAELYAGEEHSYWRFGRASGEWALTEGPYRRLREEKSLAEFVASGAVLYRNYFTEGQARTTTDGQGTVDFLIEGIPPRFHHLYFEYSTAGYFERGLELVTGRPVRRTRIAGFSAGDDRIQYRFRIG